MSTPKRLTVDLPAMVRESVSDISSQAKLRAAAEADEKVIDANLPLAEILAKTRALVGGSIPFEDRIPVVDGIVKRLQSSQNQATTEVYARSVVNLAIAFKNGDVPRISATNTLRFIIGALDPRATALASSWQRMLVKCMASVLTTDFATREAANPAVAVVLYHLNAPTWTEIERCEVFVTLLVSMLTNDYSELYRTSVINRVMRAIYDKNRPLSFAWRITLTRWLSLVLARRRVPFNLRKDIVNLILIALRSSAVSDDDRGTIGWALSMSFNVDFDLPYPAAELNALVNMPSIPEQMREAIRGNIHLRTLNNYIQAANR